LDILGLLFADEDGFVESEVDGRDDLLFTGLEEGELNVGEGNVDGLVFDGCIAKTVEMALQDAFDLLLGNTGPHKEVSQDWSFSLIEFDVLLFSDILFGVFFIDFQFNFFLHLFDLFFKIGNPINL
jgi:hypothetical protein